MFNTIWGKTQHQKKLADGVYSVSTASHGGIIVDESLADRYLSGKAQGYGKRAGGWLHYEEDCAWAVFASENPGLVDAGPDAVRRTLLRYYPEFISESLGKRFRCGKYSFNRAALELMPVPLDHSAVSDGTMQAIIDDAATETETQRKAGGGKWFYINAAILTSARAHGVPYAGSEGPWEVSDPDCGQRWRWRVRPDGRTVEYEFEQPSGITSVSQVILIDEVMKDKDFEADYIQPFGFRSLEHMKEIYGMAWERMLAEYVFETDVMNP